MRKTIMTILAVIITMTAMAQDEHLKMQFNFENVSGTEVTDPISGVNAKLMNQASVIKIGASHVLDLGDKNGYLNMTRAAGDVVRNLTDITISVCYRVDKSASLSGNGFFLWCFSQSAANTQTESPYLGYRLNAQRLAISTGGWGNEKGMELGTESIKGKWMHMLFRQSGTTGELFIDGELAAKATDMTLLKNTLTAVPGYNWIGRAPFSSDTNLKNTLVADFRVYDMALDNSQIRELAAEARRLEMEYKYGEPGDMNQLQKAVDESREWMGSAGKGYAPNAIAELEDVIQLAEMELQTARASQILIDEYIASINSMMNKAIATEGYIEKQVFSVKGDYGFVHPGGVVSQQDIDRAKQLLAEGDTKIKSAWQKLCNNEYAQAGVATYPVWDIIRGGSGTQNYMNAARGAAMAYQNALRWKIGGTKANADAAVRILMAWCNGCNSVGGDTNMSLAAGIYGHEFANAAELMRDYEGWSKEDFEKFKQWMVRVWYNKSIDFLRRRHDTWLNARYASLGERPGHYWSNWGLCNALCVMSIGILCDDVHMYNQGVSFYKYDHVGTFKDRNDDSFIMNDGCDEFIGNLVPVTIPDERGPLGYLGQMQESGRDQGHTLMALGLAADICTVGLNQGDDLFAYMNDRIAAGAEFVAAMNFGGVSAGSLPWKPYDYADCRGTLGAAWRMNGPNTGGAGEKRPYWDRILGYYEGMRGVKMQYAEKASAAIGVDGGGGNYSQNSGGFDHLGFSTLTSYRPAVSGQEAITPLYGDIQYKGVTYKNQTNLGGLKYKYDSGPSKAIPADGADITLMPQLPEDAEDSGLWVWSTGETTRNITVKADHSYIYRVCYTADNGARSYQSFAIAVCGDAKPDLVSYEITANNETVSDTTVTVLCGSSVKLKVSPTTGWTNDYLWDNGTKASSVTINTIMSSRTYTCQYANQSGAVSQAVFKINVVSAMPTINGNEFIGSQAETQVLTGSTVTLGLSIPDAADPESVIWSNGSTGTSVTMTDVQTDLQITATYLGQTFSYNIFVKDTNHSYYAMLTAEKGYQIVTSDEQLAQLCPDHYFVLATDEADLLLTLKDAPKNGNKAFMLSEPADFTDRNSFVQLFQIEKYNNGYTIRNVDYDGLTLQTEWNHPEQMRTHDQPFACEWSLLLLEYTDGAWTVENGKYNGNYLGLWTTANGLRDGEELACNKGENDMLRLQIFAVERSQFHTDYLESLNETSPEGVDATPFLLNPEFMGKGFGWTMNGTWGNQRYNGAAEVWHSKNFNLSQEMYGLPDGKYTVTCQMSNGDGANTGFLFATSGTETKKAVVEASSIGSNFDAERDKMAANTNYGLLKVDIQVTGGNLKIGINDPSDGTNWIVWDNFTLTYHGNTTVGIEEIHRQPDMMTDRTIYDLQGRVIKHPQKHGIYIMNGRKFISK